MSNLRNPPDNIAQLYPTSNDWARAFPWTYSNGHRDKLETTYHRIVCKPGCDAPVEQKVRVAVARSIFWNAHAAHWDIASQIRRAAPPSRSRAGAFARASIG